MASLPSEEDNAPRANASGEKLTFEQKSAIMQDVDAKRRAAKKESLAIVQKKKAAALGISIPKKEEGVAGRDAGGGSSERSAAGGGLKAVKALSPDKAGRKGKEEAGPSAASPAGGGVKAALAIKSGGGGGKGKDKAAAGTALDKKAGAAKKKAGAGGVLAAAKAAAAAAAEATTVAGDESEATGAPATAELTAEARLVQTRAEEARREAEREQRFKEREEQRREIERSIVEEERRLRERERQKHERAKAERKKQAAFREAAFDGEIDVIRKQIDEWIEETFGATLISAKIDCADEHKTTPLSEAAGAGQTAVCELLVAHGADVNSQNAQARTPLWRAAFMDRRETAAFLLTVGGDPRLRSEAADTPAMVAPSPELTATLEGWDVEETDRLLAARAKALEGQWVPPPPDPEDTPAGQAGYFLQLPLLRFADALDSVTAESDRPVLVCDLSGKVLTYFEYTDSNLHCWARPKDVESESLRRGLLGALRYGKPFVIDMMSMELDEEQLTELFEMVQPGLFRKLLTKKVMREEVYMSLVCGRDGEEYGSAYWLDSTTAHFSFVLVNKRPMPPEWAQDAFFVMRVA